MPTARKEATVQELRDRLAGSQNLFLTDFAGLSVEEITKLRGELRNDGSTYAVVKNRDGQWVAPSLSSTTAAAAGGAATMVKTNDVRVSIAYAPGPKTYPIAGFTYLLVPEQQTDGLKGRAIVDFLWWAIHDGEKDAALLLYARLPASVVKIDEGLIRKITYQGKALLTEK